MCVGCEYDVADLLKDLVPKYVALLKPRPTETKP